MDRHLREFDTPAAVSNNIVHLYKPVGTEDEEPLQQRLATAGVHLAVLKQHACACRRFSRLAVCRLFASCTLPGSAIAL